MIPRVLVFVFFIIFLSCNVFSPSYPVKEVGRTVNIIEDSISLKLSTQDSLVDFFIQKILRFPKVDSLKTRLNGRFSFIVQGYPNEHDDYYWIQVGENSSLRFTPVYNFYCYEKGKEIKYLDTSLDSLISMPGCSGKAQHR